MKSIFSRTELGHAILASLGSTTVPRALAPWATAFEDAQQALVVGTRQVAESEQALRSALASRSERKAACVEALDLLATALVVAGRTRRATPLAGFSSVPLHTLAERPVAQLLASIQQLTQRAAEGGSVGPVGQAVRAASLAGERLTRADRTVCVAQGALREARTARHLAASAWDHAQARLRTQATAAWLDQPEVLARVFLARSRRRHGGGRLAPVTPAQAAA